MKLLANRVSMYSPKFFIETVCDLVKLPIKGGKLVLNLHIPRQIPPSILLT